MTNKKLAVYLRISDEDVDLTTNQLKDESSSISAQRTLIQRFIQQQKDLAGAECLEFLDDGYSGTNFDRPAMKQLLQEVSAGKIYCIIVKDMSRFGRNYIETGHYIEELFPLSGVRFIAINDSFDSLHYTGNTPGLEIAFKNVIYDYYSKDLSRKVTSTKRLQQKRGEFVAAKPPYGYIISAADRHRLEIDPESAGIVKMIFQMTLEDWLPARIAGYLNDHEIPTPAQRLNRLYGFKIGTGTPSEMKNQFWKASQIISILRNETVTGAIVNNRVRVKGIGSRELKRQKPENYVVIPDTHEAIIDKYTFQKVSDIIAARKTVRTDNRQRHENLFYGKIYCASCGCRMKHEVHIRSGKQKTACYYCPTNRIPNGKTCSLKPLTDRQLKQTILILLQQQVHLVWDNRMQMPKANKEELRNSHQKVLRELEQNKGRTAMLYQEYRNGSINKDRFIKAKDAVAFQNNILLNKQQDLEKKLEALDSARQKTESEQLIELTQLKTLTQNVVERFIEKLIVDSTASIQVVWKHQNLFTQ